jgi:hypothetical protein
MYTYISDMVTADTSAVKPRLPAHKARLQDRPTPAVNIRVHTNTYYRLKAICQRTGWTYDELIRELLNSGGDDTIATWATRR